MYLGKNILPRENGQCKGPAAAQPGVFRDQQEGRVARAKWALRAGVGVVPRPAMRGDVWAPWQPHPAPWPPSWVPGPHPLSLLCSDVPKGAKNFDVSGSSKLDVFVAYDSTRVTEPAGKAPWPLDTSVEVIVSADKASKDLNDLKVRAHVLRVRG